MGIAWIQTKQNIDNLRRATKSGNPEEITRVLEVNYAEKKLV